MKTMLMLLAMACAVNADTLKPMFEGVERIETVDGKVYEGVMSVKVTPAYVTVMHEGGSARVYWEKMPEEMRTAYGYDREKALEFLKAELTKRGAAQAALEKDSAAAAKVAAVKKAKADRERNAVALEAKLREINRQHDAYPSAPAPAKPVFRPNATGYRYYTTPDGKGVWLRGEE